MARSLEGGATVEVTKNGSKAPRAATAPPPARKINVCHRECPETRFFRADLGIATVDAQLISVSYQSKPPACSCERVRRLTHAIGSAETK